MYCSQTVELASVLFTGISLEKDHSHFLSLLKAVKPPIAKFVTITGLGEGIAKPLLDLDLEGRILAPSSMANQEFVNPMVSILLPPSTLGQQSRNFFNRPRETSQSIRAVVAQFPAINQILDGQVSQTFDVGERMALLHRWREFIHHVGVDMGLNSRQIFGNGKSQE